MTILLFILSMFCIFIFFWKIEGYQRKRNREYWDNPNNNDLFDNL